MGGDLAARSVLILGHPGHELYVYGWLARTRARTCVLTDGSGLDRPPRLYRTEALLAELGAEPGPVFGRWKDRELYERLLARDADGFVSVACELADFLVELRAQIVVGDAVEGFSPAHDLCRLLINAAAQLAARRLGRPVRSFDFAQFFPPQRSACDIPPGSLRLPLDPACFARKRRAAFAYTELREELEDALTRIGEDAFRSELLRPALWNPADYRPPGDPPLYERGGEALLRAGRVERVIRCAEHLRPVARALGARVAAAG
jgi:hypothetical protein